MTCNDTDHYVKTLSIIKKEKRKKKFNTVRKRVKVSLYSCLLF